MLETIIISIVTCLIMMGFILLKPSFYIKNIKIGTYWLVTLIGAIILIALKKVELTTIIDSFSSHEAVNPLKILILFISMTILSIFLDELGLFRYLANIALKYSKSNQIKLFLFLYFMVAILTIFTSNDIIVLTFTPFICAFCKNAKINPVPYLVAEFVSANTWSMFLIVGNPTNIYLANSFSIDFITYVKHMALPTIVAGLTSLIILFLLFRKSLLKKIEDPIIEDIQIKEWPLLIAGLIILFLCIVFLAISSYINVQMYIITLIALGLMSLIVLIYRISRREKPTILINAYKRAPYDLIPFLLSMFVIVLALKEQGATAKLFEILNTKHANLVYGLTSAFVANVLNNIPMSVLFSAILKNGVQVETLYGAIIGSNLGAFITPVGALAGIMWSNILHKNNIDYSFKKFILYGILIGLPAIILSSLCIF